MGDMRGGCKPTLGAVIRFKNSAATLPSVLEGLRRQTVQPRLVVGVNNQSTDGSPALMRAFGAAVIDWTEPYHHPRVLNFAFKSTPPDYVLVLSSHTVLKSPDALEKMVHAMNDPRTACVSGKWDDDPFYPDAVTWEKLRAKGMKFDSIYSNSFGLLRRKFWEETPFDETLVGMEDYAWALEQAKRGRICRRVAFDFDYQRATTDRVGFLATTTFKLAARYGLRVVWLGPRLTARGLMECCVRRALTRRPSQELQDELATHRQRLWAWMAWRWQNPLHE